MPTGSATRDSVCNVPDYGTEEVADYGGRHAAVADAWHSPRQFAICGQTGGLVVPCRRPLLRLRGRVLGIVGLGRIGTAMARARQGVGHGCAVLRSLQARRLRQGAGYSPAWRRSRNCCASSLVVSLHCPLTDETRYLINAHAIALMPDGSYLVNTARGGVVDCSAIPDALASGPFGGGRNRCAGERATAAGRSAVGGLAKSRNTRPIIA